MTIVLRDVVELILSIFAIVCVFYSHRHWNIFSPLGRVVRILDKVVATRTNIQGAKEIKDL